MIVHAKKAKVRGAVVVRPGGTPGSRVQKTSPLQKTSPPGTTLRRITQPDVLPTPHTQDYGSGRRNMPGAGDVPPPATAAPSPQEPEPSLADYLSFGRLMGEKVQQVQAQLELNGVAVRVDEESDEFLASWEEEQESQYKMFEALATKELGDGAGSAKLNRNKNRVSAARLSRRRPARFQLCSGSAGGRALRKHGTLRPPAHPPARPPCRSLLRGGSASCRPSWQSSTGTWGARCRVRSGSSSATAPASPSCPRCSRVPRVRGLLQLPQPGAQIRTLLLLLVYGR